MKRPLFLLSLAVFASACQNNPDGLREEEDELVVADDDCDPNNPDVGPDQEEVPYNGIDDDCDPLTLDDDLDEDGFDIDEDCDDENAEIYPGAYENCDGIDENCDGEADAGSPSRRSCRRSGCRTPLRRRGSRQPGCRRSPYCP